jgi:transitional endoplasmic reticulum ATPase
MSKVPGHSENNLRQLFEDTQSKHPGIIFIDELDSIAPNKAKTHGEVECGASHLLNLMDGIKGQSKIVILAATGPPNGINPALCRFE